MCVYNIYKYIHQSVQTCCVPYRARHVIIPGLFPCVKPTDNRADQSLPLVLSLRRSGNILLSHMS